MINEINGTIAIFEHGDTAAIIGWDDEGYALVPSAKGRLKRVSNVSGFIRLNVASFLG